MRISDLKKAFISIRLLALTCLLGLSLVSGCQCSHKTDVEGISKRPMAQATMESFLGGLRTADYNLAARHFGGPMEALWAEVTTKKSGNSLPATADKPDLPNMTLDEKADLLAAYVALHPGCCRDYTVGSEKMLAPHNFSVSVEFRQWPHEPVTIEFQVGFDGHQYWVLGLPPTFSN